MSTITVTPTVEADNVPPRIRLDVSDANLPGYFETTVMRNHPDGTQQQVRTPDGEALQLATSGANRVGLVYDYEAPFGQPVSYTTVEDAATVSGEVTVDADRAWLIHPGIPDLSRPVIIGDVSARTRTASRGVFYPMGRRSPIVHSDGQRKAASYTLTVYTDGDGDASSLEFLLDDLGTLLFNVSASKGYGIGTEYVSVGDVQETRPVRLLSDTARMWELSVTVTDRPVGGTTAERTYTDLLSFASYAELRASYADYQSLLAGP